MASIRRDLPSIQKSNIDVVSLECHGSRVPFDLIELVGGKKVMVGAIDVATNTIEKLEEVASTLRQALQFVDAETFTLQQTVEWLTFETLRLES